MEEWHVVASPGRSREARSAVSAPDNAWLRRFEQLKLTVVLLARASRDEEWAAALVAQVKRLLIDVGAPQGVNLKSLYERLRTISQDGEADVGRTTFGSAPLMWRGLKLDELEVLLRSQPTQFTVRVAPWSPKARLVGLAPGAAPKRTKPPCDPAAEAAYEAQLVQYLTLWPSATLGTLGLDNPPPPGVAERMSTAAFVSTRTPKVFTASELRGTIVRLSEIATRGRNKEGGRRRAKAQDAASNDGFGGDAAFSAPAQSAAPQPTPAQPPVAQPLPLPAQMQQPPPTRGPPPMYAPPSGPSCLPPSGFARLESWGGAAAAASLTAAPLVRPPPQQSILPPAGSSPKLPQQSILPRAGSYPEAAAGVTTTAQESRLMQALGGVAGAERILAHMRATEIEASDLLRLVPLAAADADAELQLLGFAEPVTRARVRAALRTATEMTG